MIPLKIFAKAVSVAHSSHSGRYRHGAVVFRGDNILSTGSNKETRSFAKFAEFGYKTRWLHAEADAIIKALLLRYDLRGASLLVVRAGRTKMCNSKPCSHCMALMERVGIKKIYYSNKEGEIING